MVAELLLCYILMLLICIVTYVVGYIYRNVHVSNCNGPQDYHKRATELKASNLVKYWSIDDQRHTLHRILFLICSKKGTHYVHGGSNRIHDITLHKE